MAAPSHSQPFINGKIYLNSPKISQEAKWLYLKKIKASDNDTTDRILDSLKTKNNFTRPFYIMVVSRIIEKADGTLGEILFSACDEFFEKNPDALIEFLYADNNSGKRYKFDWVSAVIGGVELAKAEDVKSYITKEKAVILKRVKHKNVANFEDFYLRIYKQL